MFIVGFAIQRIIGRIGFIGDAGAINEHDVYGLSELMGRNIQSELATQ